MWEGEVAGFRAGDSGGLYHMGTIGYAWRSAPSSASSVYGSNLVFNSSGVDPENSNYRAYGFPVRCVPDNKSGFR